MDEWIEKIISYFEQHEEQTFLLKTAVIVFAIMLLRTFIVNLKSVWFFMFLFAPVFFFLYARARAAIEDRSTWWVIRNNLSLMPVMYVDGEFRKEGVGWATYGIVLVNVLIYYTIQDLYPDIVRAHLLFLPLEPSLWNVPISLVSSMFLHGSSGHLWGNMLFLWAVGTVVERRIGWQKMFGLYLCCGIIGNLFGVAVLYLFTDRVMHCLGASGAIAGLMGVFAVRCYFKTMVFPLPVLGLLSLFYPLALKVKLNALTVISFFFLLDLSRGFDQVAGVSFSRTAHWVHIGGMIAGVVCGFCLKLQQGAVSERHLEIGLDISESSMLSYEQREKSLRKGLSQTPEDLPGLLQLARIKSQFEVTDEGNDLYHKVLRQLISKDPQKATEVFLEYLARYNRSVEPSLHFHLAGMLYRQSNLPQAARTLRMLSDQADMADEWVERGMFQEAVVLKKMGALEAAENTLQIFIERFPDSVLLPKARTALAG